MTETYTTSLGDYLSLIASKEGISKSDLEKRIEIGEVFGAGASFFSFPENLAMEEFEKKSKGYDAIVDMKITSSRALFGLVSSTSIYGTGVKLKNKNKK